MLNNKLLNNKLLNNKLLNNKLLNNKLLNNKLLNNKLLNNKLLNNNVTLFTCSCEPRFGVAGDVNRASPWPICNISTSSCEPRRYRPFVVRRSQMGQFPRKAKCKIISPYLSLTFFYHVLCLPQPSTL